MFDPYFQISVGFDFKDLWEDTRKHEHSREFKDCVIAVCEEKLGPLTREKMAPSDVPQFAREGLMVPAQTVQQWLEAYLREIAPKGHGLAVFARDAANCRYTQQGWVTETGFTMTRSGWIWHCNEIVERYVDVKNDEYPWNDFIKLQLAAMEILIIVSWTLDMGLPA